MATNTLCRLGWLSIGGYNLLVCDTYLGSAHTYRIAPIMTSYILRIVGLSLQRGTRPSVSNI